MALCLEIVEGVDAGRRITLDHPVVVGRDDSADVVVDDPQVSRKHVRIRPEGASALVEDLGSSNGTFVNGNQVHATAALDAGDELLIGVTLFHTHANDGAAVQHSAVRQAPPALAVREPFPALRKQSSPRLEVRLGPPPLAAPQREPDYVPADPSADVAIRRTPGTAGAHPPELSRLVDTRVRAQARLAPLAILALATLIVVLYLATR